MNNNQGSAMLPTGARFGSRIGSLSKSYIDPVPGAAHCWPISVHIRFGFKLYITTIRMLTKGAFLSQTEHSLASLKASLGPAMPYPSMLYRQATTETALLPSQDCLTHRACNLRPSSTPLDTPQCTPMLKTTAGGSVIRN
jgi:hypothetical protein